MTWARPAVAKDPATVSASDKAAARAAMDRGDDLFDEGKHREALDEYRKADDIMGVPSTGVLLGKAQEAVGHLVEARDTYLAVGRYKHTPGEPLPDTFVAAMKLAEQRATSLAKMIPTLKIVIAGLEPGVTPEVELNQAPINVASLTRRVNPGPVTVKARAPGYLEQSETVNVAQADVKTVTITLTRDPNVDAIPPGPGPLPDPTPAPSPMPTPNPGGDAGGDGGTVVPAAIAFGVGGAGLVLGAIFGGLTIAKEGDLEDVCDKDKRCSGTNASLIDEATTLANVSNAGFIIGGVGVAAGVIFLIVFSGDDAPEAAAMTPVLSPELIGIAGRF